MKAYIRTTIIIGVMNIVYAQTLAICADVPQVLDIPMASELKALYTNKNDTGKMRNPFFWPEGHEHSNHFDIKRKPFHLEAILWTDRHPLALINGKLVEEGDAIGDAIVLAIEKDMVLIKGFDGVEQELHMRNDILEVFGQ